MPAPEGNQYALGNNGGRPTDFQPEYVEMVRKLCAKGFTDAEVADFFDVSIRTIYNWKANNEEFLQAFKLGKEAPDERTERSLYHRANGYSWKEQQAFKLKDIEYQDGKKVRETERVEVVDVKKHVPPDATSAIFWLCNRRKDEWRQKNEHVVAGDPNAPIEHKHDIAFVIVDPASN